MMVQRAHTTHTFLNLLSYHEPTGLVNKHIE
jgi:hypothetical protein